MFDGIADQVGNNIYACAEVNAHRHKRVPQVVHSNTLNAGKRDITVKSVRQSIFMNGRRSAERRLKMYNHFYALRGQTERIDVGDVYIEFKHTAPTNDLETAQIVSMLYGKPLVSNETLTKQFSFVNDAKAENQAATNEATSEASNALLAQLAGYGYNGGAP